LSKRLRQGDEDKDIMAVSMAMVEVRMAVGVTPVTLTLVTAQVTMTATNATMMAEMGAFKVVIPKDPKGAHRNQKIPKET
jgi:hypothetical protein